MPGLVVKFCVGFFSDYFSITLGVFKEKKDVMVIVSSFAFTMLGFLAAIIAIFITMMSGERYKRLQRRGGLSDFLNIYLFSVFCHFATFVFSILAFSSNVAISAFSYNAAMIMLVNNMVQLFVITLSCVGMLRPNERAQ